MSETNWQGIVDELIELDDPAVLTNQPVGKSGGMIEELSAMAIYEIARIIGKFRVVEYNIEHDEKLVHTTILVEHIDTGETRLGAASSDAFRDNYKAPDSVSKAFRNSIRGFVPRWVRNKLKEHYGNGNTQQPQQGYIKKTPSKPKKAKKAEPKLNKLNELFKQSGLKAETLSSFIQDAYSVASSKDLNDEQLGRLEVQLEQFIADEDNALKRYINSDEDDPLEEVTEE